MTLDKLPTPLGSGEAVPTPPPGTWVQRHLVFVLGCGVAGALLAVPAAWLWSLLAEVPQGVVFDGEVFYDETQLGVQAGLTLWFIVIGMAFGAGAGLVVGLLGKRHGVVTVGAVVVLCAVATVVTGLLGAEVFGPDEAMQVAAASDGDTIETGLDVATWVGYLGWPIGGLVGVLAAIAGWPRESPRSASD